MIELMSTSKGRCGWPGRQGEMLDDLRGPLFELPGWICRGGSCNTRTQVEQLHFELGVEEEGRINNVQ
jgi:hypothetical protein